MPSKRIPLRRRRRPPIDDEALKLFAKLERTPRAARRSTAFKKGDEELARRLELWGEWRTACQSVLDTGYRPPEWLAAHDAWRRCVETRETLLALAEARGLL
jgi:hypothetical protein